MFSSIGQSLVSWLLRKYLDKYVEDIETHIKGFQYGLSGGTLVLDNLNLKAEALVELDLPIEVKAGHIETLEVGIPAPTKLLTDPLVVKVENLLLLASPICDRKYDEEKDELIQQAHKRQLINKLEQLLQQEQGTQEGESAVKDPGLMEKIKVTALQNLQVEIVNIHIRYEDDVTNQSNPFAFGITLQELSLQRTNSTENTAHHVNKLLKLKELAVYWNRLDSKEQMLKDSLEEFKSAMACSIDENQLKGVTFDHLIAPINGSANLVVNLQEKSKQPVITCTGCFDHITINFKRHMFLNAVILKDSFALMRVNEKYRRYHPGVPCRGNAALWWRYAYDSILQEVVIPKKQFWNRIWEYRHRYKRYRDLYTKSLLSPNNSNEAVAAELDECELSLNIESIVMARKEAEKQYLLQKPNMAVVKPANEGIISRLSNWWYGEPEPTEVVVHAKHLAHEDDWWQGLSDEERQEVYNAFDYNQEEPSDSAGVSTYVKYAIDVKFEGIQCNLLMNAKEQAVHIASLYVAGIKGQLAVKSQGFKLESKIEHLEVFHSMDPTNRKFLAKIDNSTVSDGTCTTTYSDAESFLSVMVEQYPSDIDADVSVKVQSLPLRLVYDHEVACSTMAFFYMPVKNYTIGTTLKSLSPEFSTAGLQYAIDKNMRVHVEATLCSPYLVIPSEGLLSSFCSQLIVDLGILKVSTELRPKDLRLENKSLADRERAIYDKYTLDLSDVKILYTINDARDTNNKRRMKDSDIHVMPALSLVSVISISAEPNFQKLPKFKVESELDSLQLKLSTSSVESLLTTIYTYPRPSAQKFSEMYCLSADPSPSGSREFDCVDNAVGRSGLDYVLRSELRTGNILLDEIDFEQLQRLENRDIFVTQGDLLNLWFLLSKESRAKGKNSGDACKGETIGGLNDVVDFLLEPDEPDGRSVRIQDYGEEAMKKEDDEEFVLAEEMQPSGRLDLPGLNGYTGAEFYTLLYTSFTIGEMSVKLKCGQQDYLSASVEGVAGQVCKTNCCLSVSMQMRHLRVTDDLHLDVNRGTLYLAYSPESQAMASFEGRFMDDVSKVTFTNTANAIFASLATIQLCLHDESTKQIIQEVNKIVIAWNVLQKTQEPQSGPPQPTNAAASVGSLRTEKDVFYDAVSRLDTASLQSRRSLQFIESAPSGKDIRRSKSLHDKPDQVICDIKCCLNNIKLDVQKGFNIIAHLDLSDLTVGYVLKKDLWSVDGTLGALSLVNPKASIYQKVLVVEEGMKDVMTFHFASFDRSEQPSRSCDQEISLKLRRMRLVFINKFVSRLTKYFGQFSIPGSEKVNKLSREKLSSGAQVVQKEGTIIHLDVKIKAPLIIVPENGQSHSALLFQLGDLSIDNECITEHLSSQSQKFDQMTICLRNIAIERIKYVNERKYLAVRHLLTPVTTTVICKRALAPIAKSAVDFDIKAEISQFKIEATQLDMQSVGKVLFENILVQDVQAQHYDVTDVGSTISSALSSTGSSTKDDQKALSICLCLSKLLVYLKNEQAPSHSLQSTSSDLAIMNIAELKLDFCKGKKDSGMSCVATVRDFTIEDKVVAVDNECNTNRVIQLDDTVNQVLLVKYDVKANGDSNLFCSVQEMRFNVNLPFLKGVIGFFQESFSTWKPPESPKPQRTGRRARKRRRKQNTAIVSRRASLISLPRSEAAANVQNSKMVIEVKLGRQSLYIITGDGSHKALVAEMNLVGKAELGSGGKQEADLQLTDLSVYVTSLQSDKSHLKHTCLSPCDISITYKNVSPLPHFKEAAPAKMDIELFLTKVDIKLSTNVIYHVFDAMELFKVTDVVDDVTSGSHEPNEADLGTIKEIDRNEWLDHHYADDDIGDVEMNPTKAAVESLTISEFKLDLEFAVAIGEEFVPILKTRSCLSASVKDWSTRVRAECCFSLECNYYNELLDVWEPLVECVFDEETNEYRRWGILARLTTAKSHPIVKTDPKEILVDHQELDTFIHHQLSSVKEREKDFLTSDREDITAMDEVDHHSVSGSYYAPSEVPAIVISHPTQHDAIKEEDEDEDDHFGLPQRPLLLARAGVPMISGLHIDDKPEDIVDNTVQVVDNTAHMIDNIDQVPVVPDVGEDQIREDEPCEDLADWKMLCRYVSLVSRDRLLVNATPQGINVVTSVVDTFTKKPNDSTLFEVYKSHPLTITNKLGLGVRVRLHRATRKLDVKYEDVSVDQNMEVNERDISAQRSSTLPRLDTSSSDNAVKTLAALVSPVSSPTTSSAVALPLEVRADLKRQQLHLSVDGYHPIPSISFRKAQSKDFNARPLNQRDKSLCLRVSTQSKHGRRHVYIYSPLQIKNHLDQPVQVSYQELTHDLEHNRHGSTRHILGRIEPDGVMNIPAAVAIQKKMQVKPVAEGSDGTASEYDESSEPLWWKDHLKAKRESSRSTTSRKTTPSATQLLTCSNLLLQNFTFKAVWVPRACQADECSGTCPSFDVSLEPVLKVSNFLPFPATLDVHANVSVGHRASPYTMEPGQNVQLTDSMSSPTKCTLVIPSYQGSSWRTSLDLHDSMSECQMVPLTLNRISSGSSDVRVQATHHTLTILINVNRSTGYKGCLGQLRITFFSAYWISNSTGLTLQFKSTGIGSHSFESSGPSPILFMASAFHNKLKLRIPGSKWSKSFAVDAAGTVGSVNSPSQDGRRKHRFMVETTLSNTQLTKIINIFPLFVVLNKMEEALMFRETTSELRDVGEADRAAHDDTREETGLLPMKSLETSWTEIRPEEVVPFWPTSREKPQTMAVKRANAEVSSSSFPVSIPQRTLLPMHNQAAITADVSGGLGTEFYITLRPYQLGDCVVRLENLTKYSLCFTQGSMSDPGAEASHSLTLDYCKSWLYFWPNPKGERQLYWYAPEFKGKPQLAKFTQDGYGEVKYEENSIYWQSYGDNLQRVLTFSESTRFQKIIHKKGQREQADMFMYLALESAFLSFINKNSLEIAILSFNQSPSKWFVKIDDQEMWFFLGVKLSSAVEEAYCDPSKNELELTYQSKKIKIDLSELRFVEPLQGDLRRDSFPGLKFQYQKSELSMVIQASINHMQLDNQLPDAFYPVAFHPLAPRNSNSRPCIQVFIKKHFPLAGCTYAFKRVDVDLQHCALRIDKGFTLSFLDFITDCTKSGDADPDTLTKMYHKHDVEYAMRDLAEDTTEKMNKTSGAKVYIEYLCFSNVQIKLSFSMGGNAHLTDVGNTQSTFGGDVVDFLFRSIGMTLTEVTDIDFSLDEFTVTCAVFTTGQMSNDLLTFYKSQAINQAYVFILGLDIIGNPLGLAKNVRRGLKDFFASADPLNFDDSSQKSLAQGVKSAYANIVGGVCGTGSKITESVGRGLNLLTFDKSFQKARGRRVKSQPSHLAESVLLSGKTFGYAIGSGVTGLVSQPKKGVQRQGAPGFFKGVGKGLTGIVIKPAAGVFDSVSVLLGGLRRAAQSDMNAVERMRLPRHTIPSEGLTRYHPYLSEGVEILHTTANYTYAPDNVYWSHMELTIDGKKYVILATTKMLALLHLAWYSSYYRPVWCIPIEDLCKPALSQGVIILTINGQGERKRLESRDIKTLDWFYKRLKALRGYSKATYKTTL